MNILAAVAGVLTLLAFGIHAVVGGREFSHINPQAGSGKAQEVWAQAVGGWHWVSVDLLLAALVLLTVGFTEAIADEPLVLLIVSGYFVLCSLVWLATVWIAGAGVERRLLKLSQWLFCLLIAALAFFAR